MANTVFEIPQLAQVLEAKETLSKGKAPGSAQQKIPTPCSIQHACTRAVAAQEMTSKWMLGARFLTIAAIVLSYNHITGPHPPLSTYFLAIWQPRTCTHNV